ncbi:c-type cytochrome [Myxacorys almedinensis A]|uniref:Cytochrome c6 n=2 Tax=Myxacorys TaxID=2056239 RepID=A0A8J7Z3F8_9CYAN|nr:c-type cytochrome [Myxacorys almedinensis A]
MLVFMCLAIALFVFPGHDAALADDRTVGQRIFSANCSACHIGGTNVIISHKTLRKEALEKYAMNSIEAISHQVTNGKNAMPAFGGRLTDAEVEAVAQYVLQQAESGW